MAGTTDTWRTTNLALKEGRLYRTVAVPGAAARPTLDATTGTPDAAANPSAIHMGATTGGVEFMCKSSMKKYTVDEFPSPIISNIESVEMGIKGNLVAVTDMIGVAAMLPGVATRSTSTGYDYMTIGTKAVAYDCFLDIYQLIEDSTKYGWFQIYNGLNDAGVGWTQKRTEMGSIPVNIVGFSVTSRATGDTVGQIGKQI